MSAEAIEQLKVKLLEYSLEQAPNEGVGYFREMVDVYLQYLELRMMNSPGSLVFYDDIVEGEQPTAWLAALIYFNGVFSLKDFDVVQVRKFRQEQLGKGTEIDFGDLFRPEDAPLLRDALPRVKDPLMRYFLLSQIYWCLSAQETCEFNSLEEQPELQPGPWAELNIHWLPISLP